MIHIILAILIMYFNIDLVMVLNLNWQKKFSNSALSTVTSKFLFKCHLRKDM